MTLTGAIVLFACIWFLTLFCILPIGLETQGDAGKVEPGTPASAPSGEIMRRKFLLTTIITVALWAAAGAVLTWGGITIEDIDVWRRL